MKRLRLVLGSIAVGAALAHPATSQGRDAAAVLSVPIEDDSDALAVADFDGDGRLDVAVAAHQTTRQAIYLMREDDWSRWERIPLDQADAAFVIEAADLDRDGFDDVIIGCQAEVHVYYGDPGGAFRHERIYTRRTFQFRNVAVVDANGDSLLDVIAVGHGLGPVLLLQVESAGPRFPVGVVLPGPTQILGIAVGDYDDDGDDDMALSSSGGDLVVGLGDGAGGFPEFITRPNAGPVGPLATLDYDRDGRDDLAGGHHEGVRLIPNDPSHAFAPWRSVDTAPVITLRPVDWDADGVTDLVLTLEEEFHSGKSGVFALRGLHESGPRRPTPILQGIVTEDVRAVDFDRDGFVDVVVDTNGRQFDVARGSPRGFIVPTMFDSPLAKDLAVSDFDGDGHADIVFSTGIGGSGFIRTLKLDGAGGVLSQESLGPRLTPTDWATGDLNGDGRPDLLSSGEGGKYVSSLLRTEAGWTFAGRVLELRDVSKPVIGDFDGDGAADFAVMARLGSVVHALLGDGAGGFARRVEFPLVGSKRRLFTGDFDEDGFADLAADFGTQSGGDGVRVFFGDPSGFRGSSDVVLHESTFLRAVADTDEDGHLDFLIHGVDRTRFATLFGDGAGGVSRITQATLPVGADELLLGDVDGDGHLDMVSLQNSASRTDLYSGDGTGSFSLVANYSLGAEAKGALADFDEDGRIDLAVTSFAGDVTSIVLPYARDPRTPLPGTVNRRFGPPANVLFVNESSGGVERRVVLTGSSPILATMAAPPRAIALGVPFALFAWEGEPTLDSYRTLTLGLGTLAMPPPFLGGSPRVVWNSTGREKLGQATEPRSPLAPAVVFRKPTGARRPITFTLQGVIADPGSRAERPASVTNGIVVEVR